jgi:hypothetical protein
VAVAQAAAIAADQPNELRAAELWETRGRLVRVTYTDLAPPLSVPPLSGRLLPFLPERYSPLNRNGTGNQGYLFALPPRAARLLLAELAARDQVPAGGVPLDERLEAAAGRATPDETVRTRLVRSRIGQGWFRDQVLRLWGDRCCVTGLTIPALVRASHIRPWQDSDNAQRLDPYNGLPLAAGYDAAFDAGLITFEFPDGRVRLAAGLTEQSARLLGITPDARIEGLAGAYGAYLAYHAAQVFAG